MKLTTNYKVDDAPLCEYPRPQMQRASWLCLNGWWDFAKVKRTDYADEFPMRIKVPFSPESQLSGIEEGFTLLDDEKLVYQRAFVLDKTDACVLLHFGAVDQACEVFVNGNLVCTHRGGFTPFSVDVGAYARVGENVLRVECTDETEKSEGARGKQSSTPGGIWYTKQSGIWQTVWLECVPEKHIRSLTVKTDAATKQVNIFSACDGEQTLRVYDEGNLIIEKTFTGGQVCVEYNFTLWSPESPKLYDFTLQTASGDMVSSYFGVRSFGVGKDEKGKARLCIPRQAGGGPYLLEVASPSSKKGPARRRMRIQALQDSGKQSTTSGDRINQPERPKSCSLRMTRRRNINPTPPDTIIAHTGGSSSGNSCTMPKTTAPKSNAPFQRPALLHLPPNNASMAPPLFCWGWVAPAPLSRFKAAAAFASPCSAALW